MISILIPVYNTSVVELVKSLQRQCLQLPHQFEIICLDDASSPEYRRINTALSTMEGVIYKELETNIGRSRIRNRLADMAGYPYLLFMDGDSKVVRANYLSTYLENLGSDTVIYGGRVYQENPPPDPLYRLHWHYGCQREALPAAKRREYPYRTFMTNNFVVPKAIATRIRFDESITRYGYEDTLYALELQKNGFKIRHIENPLEHIGLERRPVFLRKVEEALDNLKLLLPQHPQIDTRLLQLIRKLDKKGMLPLVKWSGKLYLGILKRMLLFLPKAPLKLLDLYKLGYFLK